MTAKRLFIGDMGRTGDSVIPNSNDSLQKLVDVFVDHQL
jgi:hypothetical protein